MKKQHIQNGTGLKFYKISSLSLKSTHQIRSAKHENHLSRSKMPSQKSFFTKQYDTPKAMSKHESFKPLNCTTIKEMEGIRDDLTKCMSSITLEQGKYSTLKSLIAILQQHTRQMEESQKHVKDVEHEEALKRTHKIEYDIEQILQKHNEEIAKINNLKQQSASARSDRVVFSNLFRKIEKEIKQHEKDYKETILKTEIFRQKRAKRLKIQAQKQTQDNMREQSEMKQENLRISNYNSRKPKFNSESRLFVTSFPEKLKKVSFIGKKPSLHFQQIHQQSQLQNAIQFKIKEVQSKIQKLIKVGQCSNYTQTIKFYNNVLQENDNLCKQILFQERKIQQIETEIQRMKKQKKTSQFSESRHINNLQALASNRKIRGFKPTITEDSQELDQDIDIIYAIFDELGIPHQKPIDYLITNQDTLRVLQSQIDSLSAIKPYTKSDSNTTCGNISEHELDTIFTKMQRFDNCEKILNKKQLYSEYMKEVGKSKRVLRYRK